LNSIIQYVKTLSPAFAAQNSPKPIPLPSNVKGKVDLVKGKEVFQKLQCALCHGPEGRANGTSAFTLVDGWNHPIRPADLTEGWTYRGGQKPIDIYYRVFAGLDGAPMPSYDGAVTPEDGWHLANYVSSMQLKANWIYEIIAVSVKGPLPTSADSNQWEKAPRTEVNLQGYFYENGRRTRTSVNAVSVQVLKNEKDVAFRLRWDDPVRDDKSPSDAFSVAFKPRDFSGDPRANLHTLYTPDSAPLDLMMWQASQPKQVGQKVSTLYSAVHPGWTPASSFEATPTYNDGVWSLVFARPQDLGSNGADFKQPTLLIGFTAWDGHNGDSQLKYSTSQWIRLVLEAPKQEH
jgi:DMSO reductase family type II enzyme heme b subunit